jgi:hypothetical protein
VAQLEFKEEEKNNEQGRMNDEQMRNVQCSIRNIQGKRNQAQVLFEIEKHSLTECFSVNTILFCNYLRHQRETLGQLLSVSGQLHVIFCRAALLFRGWGRGLLHFFQIKLNGKAAAFT